MIPYDVKIKSQSYSPFGSLLKLSPTAAQPTVAAGPASTLAFPISGSMAAIQAFRGRVQIAAGR